MVTNLGLETRLEPVVVSVNGMPVAVSNDVILYSELEGKYGAQLSKFPIVYVIVPIVVVAAIIAFVLIIRARKKETA